MDEERGSIHRGHLVKARGLGSTETLHVACLLAQHTEQMVDEKQELETNLGYTVNLTRECG